MAPARFTLAPANTGLTGPSGLSRSISTCHIEASGSAPVAARHTLQTAAVTAGNIHALIDTPPAARSQGPVRPEPPHTKIRLPQARSNDKETSRTASGSRSNTAAVRPSEPHYSTRPFWCSTTRRAVGSPNRRSDYPARSLPNPSLRGASPRATRQSLSPRPLGTTRAQEIAAVAHPPSKKASHCELSEAISWAATTWAN